MSVILNQTDFSDGMKGRKGQFSRPSEKSVKSLENLIPDSSGSLHNRAPAILSELPVRKFDRVLAFEFNEERYFFVYDSLLKCKWYDVTENISRFPANGQLHQSVGTDYVDQLPDAVGSDYLRYLTDCFRARFFTTPHSGKLYTDVFPDTLNYTLASQYYDVAHGHAKIGSRIAIDATTCSYRYTRCLIYREGPYGFSLLSSSVLRPWLSDEDTGEETDDSITFSEWNIKPEVMRGRFYNGHGTRLYSVSVGVEDVVFYDKEGFLPTLVYNTKSKQMVDLRVLYHGQATLQEDIAGGNLKFHPEEWSTRPVICQSHGHWEPQALPFLQLTNFNSPFLKEGSFEDAQRNAFYQQDLAVYERLLAARETVKLQPGYDPSKLPPLPSPPIGGPSGETISPLMFSEPGDGMLATVYTLNAAPLAQDYLKNSYNYEGYSKAAAYSGLPDMVLNMSYRGNDLTEASKQDKTYRCFAGGGAYDKAGDLFYRHPRRRNGFVFRGMPIVQLRKEVLSSAADIDFFGVSGVECIFGIYVGNPYFDFDCLYVFVVPALHTREVTQGYGYVPYLPVVVKYTKNSRVTDAPIQYDFYRSGGRISTAIELSERNKQTLFREEFILKYGCSPMNRESFRFTQRTIKAAFPSTLKSVTPGNRFKVCEFDQGRFILASSTNKHNELTVGAPVSSDRSIFDFDTLERLLDVTTMLPQDKYGFVFPLTSEEGIQILWAKRLRETFYIGTNLGLIQVKVLLPSALTEVKINRSVSVPISPVTVFNQLLFSSLGRNKILTLENSFDVQREVVKSVSDNIFEDFLKGDEIVSFGSSLRSDFFILQVKRDKESLVYGKISGVNVSYSRLSFGGIINSFSLIDSSLFVSIEGKGLLACDLDDFSQPIEDSAVLGLDLLSPSVLSYSDKQNVTEDRLSNTVFAGKLVGDFNGPVDITSEHMEKTGQLPFKSVDPHEVSFSDVPRGDIFDSVKFKFKGRKVTVLAAKYGVRT